MAVDEVLNCAEVKHSAIGNTWPVLDFMFYPSFKATSTSREHLTLNTFPLYKTRAHMITVISIFLLIERSRLIFRAT